MIGFVVLSTLLFGFICGIKYKNYQWNGFIGIYTKK